MVRFTEFDGYLLWCLPDPGCDLSYWIRAYTFFNRDAVPDYPVLAECLQRSVLAGVMQPPVGGHYGLSPEWRSRVRQWEDQSAVPEDDMGAFAEWLSSSEWPVVCPTGYALGRDEYEAAVAGRYR